MPDTIHLLIDGCAVNRFALVNVDPMRALDGGGVRLAVTPELESEYRAALDHLFVPSYVKRLLNSLLERCERIGGGQGEGTDRGLAELARTALVVTDDAALYRRWGGSRPGLIFWPEVEAHLKAEGLLLTLLSARAAGMTRMTHPGPA